MPTLGELDPATRAYLAAVVARVEAVLGSRLLGAYAGGSIALGAYDPAGSDVDLAMVVVEPLDPALKEALVERPAPRTLGASCAARSNPWIASSRSRGPQAAKLALANPKATTRRASSPGPAAVRGPAGRASHGGGRCASP